MQHESQTTYRVITVCLLLLALLSLFAPLSREAQLWVKIISLAAITVVTLPLAHASEEEKGFSLLKVSAYLVLFLGTMVFVDIITAKPDTAAVVNETALLFDVFLESTVFLWGASLGVYLNTLGTIAVRNGGEGLMVLIIGIVAVAFEMLLCYLPAFTQNRSLALQLTGVAYLVLALGYWRTSVLVGYGLL